MDYRIIVLVKQVPDTKAVTPKAMKDDGTLNRSALTAIFNPEDLNALETALQLRERFGGTVTVVTMGPPAAAEVLRESLYRGVDEVILLTDRRFAASDTLATSYILSQAIKKLAPYNIILCGRQAIDGNTAQVGPQVAEKLDINQVTFVEEIVNVNDGEISSWRSIEGGYELLEAPLPALLTIVDTANDPRPASAKKVMQFKKAKVPSEIGDAQKARELQEKGLLIKEWNAESIGVDLSRCGVSGSPTKVKKIKSVVLKKKEFKKYQATDEGMTELLQELIHDHTFD
jgi:electron transfer flavoprotein beta subunit